MTASTVETAREGGANVDGLRRQAMKAGTEVSVVGVTSCKCPDAAFMKSISSLLAGGHVIQSLNQPTAVVGRKLSGKSRLNEMKTELESTCC